MQLEKRDIVKCVLLSIITCGIYGIVWAVKMARDAVRVKDVNDDGTLEIVLMIFVPFLGFFLAERKLNDGCQMNGIDHKDNSILYLVLGLFGLGIVNYCLMQSDLNKIAEAGYYFGAANVNPGQNYQQGGYQPNYQPQDFQQQGGYQQNNGYQQNGGYQQPPYQNPQYNQPYGQEQQPQPPYNNDQNQQ